MTRSKFIRTVKIFGIVLIIILILGYALWRSLSYLRGPQINIFQPINGSTVSSSTVDIVGRADRISSLSIFGNPISVDQSGNFTDKIIVFHGVNIITLDASDQFGRHTKKQLEIYGSVDLPLPQTTTVSTSTSM